MKTIKLNDYKITTTDTWTIGSFSLLGLGAGFFVPETSAIAFFACLMVGVGFGLVFSSIFTKNNRKSETITF